MSAKAVNNSRSPTLLVSKTHTSRFEPAITIMGFLVLVLCVLLSPLVFCREGSQGPRKQPEESTKIDILCSSGGCHSDCGFGWRATQFNSIPFCLDERLSEKSPSYILNEYFLFMRVQLVLETNISVVGLIQNSFSLPASFFTSQTLELPPERQITDLSGLPVVETFSELKAMDSALSGLKVGDPYCVWQIRDLRQATSCAFSSKNGPLDVPTVSFSTGQFGFSCSVKRFRRN